MIALRLGEGRTEPLRLLFLGAHSDDIEIGCGGTILQLLSQGVPVHVGWVVMSGRGVRAQEARTSAARFLAGAAATDVIVQDFEDGYFPAQVARIKPFFETLKGRFAPDAIFTHHLADRHQDHRTVAELTFNTWRRHLILEYEIPKYDGDLGQPNVFVPLDRSLCERKARAICESFRSEGAKDWMSEDTFVALARLRGVECGAPGLHAEAFHGRKLVLGL